ncbi:MAG: PKD domain-containing protein [Chloroflexota bacterium]
MGIRRLISLLLLAAWVAVPVSALAQDGLSATVSTSTVCTSADFALSVAGGSGSFSLTWDFGDGESLVENEVISPHLTSHVYPAQGEYAWSVSIVGPGGLTVAASGTLVIAGPEVILTSDPFPPLLILEDGGSAQVDFRAHVVGGSEPYQFSWDLDGDGQPEPNLDPTSPSASYAYTEPGHYIASVSVTDSCGLTDSDTLPVVVLDSEAACHPMAQRIANALNALEPGRTNDRYTCQDIYDFFTGGWTGSQLGFGRMWHAYQLSLVIDDLTWEEILDWQLDGTGWGLLVQFDRIAETLQEVPLSELVGLVTSGQVSIQDIRRAFQVTVHYEADFRDALSRLQDGSSPGEIGQFYRAVEELGLSPEVLDGYLEQGMRLPDVNHAAQLAEQQDAVVEDVLEALLSGLSWGEIRQTYRDNPDQGQGAQDEGQSQGRNEQQIENLRRLVFRLAERYGVSPAQLTAQFESACGQDWGCVLTWLRAQVRQQNRGPGRP